MNNDIAKALQVVIFSLDDEAGELAVQDYLRLLQELKANLENRIRMVQIEVEKKVADIK